MTSGRDSERGEMYQEVERERVSPVHVTPSKKKIGANSERSAAYRSVSNRSTSFFDG
jgi:hypothetical protein